LTWEQHWRTQGRLARPVQDRSHRWISHAGGCRLVLRVRPIHWRPRDIERKSVLALEFAPYDRQNPSTVRALGGRLT
jgi:hypothetical protein